MKKPSIEAVKPDDNKLPLDSDAVVVQRELHPLFISHDEIEIPIQYGGGSSPIPAKPDGTKPPAPPFYLQLLTPREVPTGWAYDDGLRPGVSYFKAKPGITLAAYNYLLVQTLRFTAQGFRNLVLPKRIMDVFYEAQNKGGKPIAELLEMMSPKPGEDRFPKSVKADLSFHFEIISRELRRVRFVCLPPGRPELKLSITRDPKPQYQDGCLSAPPISDAELRTMLWRLEDYIDDANREYVVSPLQRYRDEEEECKQRKSRRKRRTKGSSANAA